ncbi:tetratricopeptide repeat protein [Candidatus Saccharibacteria bacterium]|nr:tetratricopeptide repeat protein [Candidatus Saccharibacteria bacterium]
MIAVALMMAFAVFVAFFMPIEAKEKPVEEKSPKYKAQMKKLWQVAQTAMKEHKPSRAEKALLTILKFDEKNAAAYNRLGILYAKSKKFDEAVECFEIAQSLDNNPASIHNAGLIYLEVGAYEKAEMAFLQAIELEGDVPARFMALAKAEEKLGNTKKAIEALENAYELDPTVATLRQILMIYEASGDTEAATATTARIEEQIARDNVAKRKRAKRAAPRAVISTNGGAANTRTRIVRKVKKPVAKPRTGVKTRV